MRISILLAAQILGCTGNLGTDGNTDGPIGHDDSGSSEEMAFAAMTTTIGGVPESCSSTAVTSDDEIMGEGSTDPEAKNWGVEVFPNTAFTFFAGRMAIPDMDGNPLHVKNVGSEDAFYYCPPMTDQLAPGEVKTSYACDLVRHVQGENIVCITNSWWYDASKPDFKGEQFRTNEEAPPIDLQVKGAATWTDPETGEIHEGAQLLVNGGTGEIGGLGSGGTWVMLNNQIKLQPEEGEEISVTASTVATAQVGLSMIATGVAVVETTCPGLDATRE